TRSGIPWACNGVATPSARGSTRQSAARMDARLSYRPAPPVNAKNGSRSFAVSPDGDLVGVGRALDQLEVRVRRLVVGCPGECLLEGAEGLLAMSPFCERQPGVDLDRGVVRARGRQRPVARDRVLVPADSDEAAGRAGERPGEPRIELVGRIEVRHGLFDLA